MSAVPEAVLPEVQAPRVRIFVVPAFRNGLKSFFGGVKLSPVKTRFLSGLKFCWKNRFRWSLKLFYLISKPLRIWILIVLACSRCLALPLRGFALSPIKTFVWLRSILAWIINFGGLWNRCTWTRSTAASRFWSFLPSEMALVSNSEGPN